MPFQGPSIFRRSCILDSVHHRCSLPPPLGPSPGTLLGLSAGGTDLAEALQERNGGGTVPGTGTLGGLLLPRGCLGGPASSPCPSPELSEMAFNCVVGISRTRCRLYCGVSKGTAWARWYPVPVPGAGPFARMTLGGTRSAGIPLLGMGMEDAKPLLTLQACTSSPCTFCRNPSVKPQGLPRVARPVARAGRNSLGAAPLDPRVAGCGSSRSKDRSTQMETSPK